MPSAITSFGAGTVIQPTNISSQFGGFFRNKIINGDFDIWQRATSFSTPNNEAYTADRWIVSYNGTIGAFTVSQQSHTVGQTAVPDEPQYFLRWNHTSAGSGSTFRRISQKIESVRTLAAKTATVTFYAKIDSANNVTGTLVQNFGSGGSASVSTSLGTFALTTSWQKFTTNVAIPTISGKTVGTDHFLEFRLDLPINTTMVVDISHVQIEENGITPFEQSPIGLVLSLCQRFYQTFPVYVLATTTTLTFKGSMRKAPTIAGGGSGFASASVTTEGGTCSQTSAATQTLTFDAEL